MDAYDSLLNHLKGFERLLRRLNDFTPVGPAVHDIPAGAWVRLHDGGVVRCQPGDSIGQAAENLPEGVGCLYDGDTDLVWSINTTDLGKDK